MMNVPGGTQTMSAPPPGKDGEVDQPVPSRTFSAQLLSPAPQGQSKRWCPTPNGIGPGNQVGCAVQQISSSETRIQIRSPLNTIEFAGAARGVLRQLVEPSASTGGPRLFHPSLSGRRCIGPGRMCLTNSASISPPLRLCWSSERLPPPTEASTPCLQTRPKGLS